MPPRRGKPCTTPDSVIIAMLNRLLLYIKTNLGLNQMQRCPQSVICSR